MIPNQIFFVSAWLTMQNDSQILQIQENIIRKITFVFYTIQLKHYNSKYIPSDIVSIQKFFFVFQNPWKKIGRHLKSIEIWYAIMILFSFCFNSISYLIKKIQILFLCIFIIFFFLEIENQIKSNYLSLTPSRSFLISWNFQFEKWTSNKSTNKIKAIPLFSNRLKTI